MPPGVESERQLVERPLGPRDEPELRRFWAREPHANLLAIPDLDFLGWYDQRLDFTGWFDGPRLAGYLMRYGWSAQWNYETESVVGALTAFLQRSARRPRFASGDERRIRTVLEHIGSERVSRYEESTVADLTQARFNPESLHSAGGRAREARLADLDALAAVHVAAPDQFNRLDYGERRMALRSAMTDGWRRVYLAETSKGTVVAAAQTIAEGNGMAVIGGVVTHPAHRGQGYATAVTAHLCSALLSEGKRAYLFYRRDNVAAERVYHKIGFATLGDWLLAELRWDGQQDEDE